MPPIAVVRTTSTMATTVRRGCVALMALLVGTLCSCAHVPPEAVQLSQRMGQDLAAVHAANRELARSYFGRLRAEADAVVDNEYRPYILEQAIANTHLLEEIDRARRPGATLDPLDLMEIFVEEATARIDSFRTELHAPIDAQERAVVRRIDDVHESLAQGNAAITAHLVSLRKIESEQDALMRRAGLPADARSQLAATLTGASDDVSGLLRRAKKGSAALDSLPTQLRAALERH